MKEHITVLSLHWGFSLGGVAKYAKKIEKLKEDSRFSLHSVCILPRGRIVDEKTLALLDRTEIEIDSIFDFSWLGKVKAIAEDRRPDVVLSHGFNGHLVNLLACSRIASHPAQLASYHGDYHATTTLRRFVQPIYNGFTQWFIRSKATGAVCVADYCLEFLADKGVSRDKMVTVHNGMTDYTPRADARESIREEWGIQPDQLLIGVASRLDPVKGLTHLVEAFASLAPKHDSARLVIMGDGTLRDDLKAQVAGAGLSDRVVFAGMRSDVPDCLAALDIFALPSLAEYHSFGLLEAMRAQLAIVATNVGGNTESVRDGREGVIVPPASAADLEKALDRLLGDNDLRETLSVAARDRFLRHFTEEAMVQKFGDWLIAVTG